nr:ribonuclease H-like domain-containing protein [Tanacetum cinerariifolium]
MVTSSSSSGSQNMAFLSSPNSTNKVDTANIQVNTVSTPVSTVSSHDNTTNLSDTTMYDFLANQPNGSQIVHEDLEQIHEDDLKKMDLKWPRSQDYSRKIMNVEDTSFKAMVEIDGAGFDWSYMADDEVPTNMALMAFLDLEDICPTSLTLGSMMEGMLPLGEELKVMCDKKNNVLFTDTECFVLSPNFKLADESQVLLKVHRKNNMYSFDMKNIVPQMDLTCLLTKATNDESMLWHRRLGIKREYSVARTPQQNRVAERRNRTLIEATRTMLADSKLPTTFCAEAVNTACYIQNKVLVVKPHFKTPYELFKGSRPELLFNVDALSKSMSYAPVLVGTTSNDFVGK